MHLASRGEDALHDSRRGRRRKVLLGHLGHSAGHLISPSFQNLSRFISKSTSSGDAKVLLEKSRWALRESKETPVNIPTSRLPLRVQKAGGQRPGALSQRLCGVSIFGALRKVINNLLTRLLTASLNKLTAMTNY